MTLELEILLKSLHFKVHQTLKNEVTTQTMFFCGSFSKSSTFRDVHLGVALTLHNLENMMRYPVHYLIVRLGNNLPLIHPAYKYKMSFWNIPIIYQAQPWPICYCHQNLEITRFCEAPFPLLNKLCSFSWHDSFKFWLLVMIFILTFCFNL